MLLCSALLDLFSCIFDRLVYWAAPVSTYVDLFRYNLVRTLYLKTSSPLSLFLYGPFAFGSLKFDFLLCLNCEHCKGAALQRL